MLHLRVFPALLVDGLPPWAFAWCRFSPPELPLGCRRGWPAGIDRTRPDLVHLAAMRPAWPRDGKQRYRAEQLCDITPRAPAGAKNAGLLPGRLPVGPRGAE